MPENGFSWWRENVLPFEPEAAYYSAAPFGTGASVGSPFGGGYAPAAQQYWSGQYGNVMNQYLGSLGSSMRADEDPYGERFVDYLDQYPWTERYAALAPTMRPGGLTSRFAPSARRMY